MSAIACFLRVVPVVDPLGICCLTFQIKDQGSRGICVDALAGLSDAVEAVMVDEFRRLFFLVTQLLVVEMCFLEEIYGGGGGQLQGPVGSGIFWILKAKWPSLFFCAACTCVFQKWVPTKLA